MCAGPRTGRVVRGRRACASTDTTLRDAGTNSVAGKSAEKRFSFVLPNGYESSKFARRDRCIVIMPLRSIIGHARPVRDFDDARRYGDADCSALTEHHLQDRVSSARLHKNRRDRSICVLGAPIRISRPACQFSWRDSKTILLLYIADNTPREWRTMESPTARCQRFCQIPSY
jgi:hypothetical protein